ncbi:MULTISPECIES: MerR family transcriptional regulator [Bacillus cereus group]|uniref:MerR family transcriptional regulator n=1 Tax=Bacillus cereus group TaxID=86661 RepID=UPI0005CE3AFE|nr:MULTISPECIES: MerR family transcriptional regulator [Bacillus cereus group]
MEYGYFAQEVAKQLDINANTLRRWSIELEKMEYIFERNDRNQRIYYLKDINVLKQMKYYLKQNWRLEEAATLVSDECETINSSEFSGDTLKDNAQEAKDKTQQGENNTETNSVQMEKNVHITLLEPERSNSENAIMKERFLHMFEQQEKVVQQNQTIIELLLQERSITEEKELEIKLLKNKLDKAITLLQEDRQDEQRKNFIQRLFNL